MEKERKFELTLHEMMQLHASRNYGYVISLPCPAGSFARTLEVRASWNESDQLNPDILFICKLDNVEVKRVTLPLSLVLDTLPLLQKLVSKSVEEAGL